MDYITIQQVCWVGLLETFSDLPDLALASVLGIA